MSRRRQQRRDRLADLFDSVLDQAFDRAYDYVQDQVSSYRNRPLVSCPSCNVPCVSFGRLHQCPTCRKLYGDPIWTAGQTQSTRHGRRDSNNPKPSSRQSRQQTSYDPYQAPPRARPRTHFHPSWGPQPPRDEEADDRKRMAARTASAYKLLKLDPKTAKPEDVKKLRRVLAMKYHPDKGGDDKTLKEINAAVDCVLSDLSHRAA